MYRSYYYDNIFASFIYFLLGAVWLFCFYRIAKDEMNTTPNKNRILNHWRCIFSLLTLVPIIVIILLFEKKLRIPTLFKAQNHGVYADFKTDGTYVIKSGAWGSKKHFYGKYGLQGSLIEIDTSNIDDILVSNRFLIKQTNPEEEIKLPLSARLRSEKYLVQIDETNKEMKLRYPGKDSAGNEIYLPYRFELIVDKSK
ncbi:MAG: hypothetical protein BGP13_15115 [Sphingobacteriales bacterium 40-81]|nr:MAG: hypothetical protein BGP13_15115 [Sphingobacteriales bacterium 40-81]